MTYWIAVAILLSGVFLLPASAATDQDRISQLQQQIQELEQQAAQYKNNIASERAKADSLNREISILKNEIKKLEIQIAQTSKKIDKTAIEITGLETDIFDTNQKIIKQEGAIARLLLFLNRQDDENLLVVLLKNHNISDFFRYAQYADSLNAQLLSAIGELKDIKEGLQESKLDLQGRKEELEELKREDAARRASLANAKSDKDGLLKVTKGNEAAYQKRLQEIERQEAEFYTELRKLENATVAGGLYIVHVTATQVPKRGSKIFQWPEDGYRLTQGYGCTKYARCGRASGPYGGAGHNGIDIAAGYGAPVKAIGSGEVVAFGFNNGFGNWVAIRHDQNGNLVSTYGHLSTFAVSRIGTRVNVGTVIGYEGTTGKVTGSHVHLSLYKDFFTYEKNGQLYFNYFDGSLNPLDYLR